MGTTPECALLTPDEDVRQLQVSKTPKIPARSLASQLTQREHVAHRRARASSFDRVTCSRIGDFDERVFAIADVVSVCNIKDQTSG